MTFVEGTYQRAAAFLFGRRTYELFAGYWGVREDLDNPIVGALNAKPKYVASTTLTEPRWANTTVLSGDLAAAIGELRGKPGGELQVHGSGTLIRWLLANDLVDEISLLIVPVVVGQGMRLFPDAGPDIALDLVDSRASRRHHEPGLPTRRAPPVRKRTEIALDRLRAGLGRRRYGTTEERETRRTALGELMVDFITSLDGYASAEG